MRVVLLAICFSLTLCLQSCNGSSGYANLLKFVPSTSNAILALDWQKVGNDEDLKRLAHCAKFETAFRELGVDSGDVSEVAAFGEFETSRSAASGLIVRGTFDAKTITQNAANRGWTEEDLDGTKVYVNPADGARLTTFEKNMFVLGTSAAVRRTIEARSKSEMRFTSTPVYNTLVSRYEKRRSPIVMVVAISQASQETANAALQIATTILDLTTVGPLAQLLNDIGIAQGIGCGISRQGDSFSVELSALMKDEEAAKFVSRNLNAVKNLAKLAPVNNGSGRGQQVAKALQEMTIETNRARLSIKLALARSEL